jgi:phage terminase large subunit
MQIALTPKQRNLVYLIENGSSRNIAFGGARGGGKSKVVRDAAVYLGFKYNINVLIFRKYRDDLLKNHIYPLLRDNPELRDNFNKTEMVLYDHNKNPVIKFDYAETEEDIYKVGQGTEYQVIFIDEASQISQSMMQYLTTACRDSKGLLPSKAKTVYTMNPGGIGHSYLKRVFIDRIFVDNEKADDYQFIQAHVWDNVFWVLTKLFEQGYNVKDYYEVFTEQQRIDFTLKYSDYADNLSGLPEDLKMANLYGDWDIFGGMFFKSFSRQLCIKPFHIPKHWYLVGAVDPGWSSTCAFTLSTKSPEGIIYHLFSYGAKETNPVQHAENINEHIKSFEWTGGRMPDLIVSGHDAWAKQNKYDIVSHEVTFADIFREKGLYLNKANISRVPGWWAWKTLIEENKWFYFDKYNKELEAEMVAVEHDKNYVEDIEGRGNNPLVHDHYLDSTRYNVMAIRTPYEKEVNKHHPSRKLSKGNAKGKTKF